MKKLLALVLALVMTLSLCVAGNAAYAGEDFDYQEAVDVMTAVGVFQGDENGRFNPKDILTREQAAKIVTYMLLGKKAADALVTIAAPFSDVAATRWSAGSIAYCHNEGILAGVGEGKFAPTEQLTGLAFAKMMLTALGYDAETEGLVGANWSINAAKLALTVGLTEDMDDVSLSAPMTREQAAQMALNTELATMVEYRDQSTITAGNVTIKTQSKATDIYTGNIHGLDAYDANNTLQFAEKYAAKLDYVASDADAFGRPGHTWEYDKKDVGTYTDKPVAVFTAETKAADIASALKGYKFVDYSSSSTFYKVENTTKLSSSKSAGLNVAECYQTSSYTDDDITLYSGETVAATVADWTYNGALLEVYANSDKVITDLVWVEYTVSEVTKVTEKKDSTSYKLDYLSSALNTYTDEDKDDEIVFVDGAAPVKGDIVTWVEGLDGVVYVYKTTSFQGAQTSRNVDKGTVVVGGTTYTVGGGVYADGGYVSISDFGNSDKTNNTYYLDQYGYVVKTTAAAASTDYAFVVAAYGKSSTNIDGTTYSVQVKAVLSDGTVGTYDVALKKSSGNYNIKNVDSTVLTTGNVAAQAQALVSNLYGYTLSDKTITFEEVSSTFAADTNVQFRNNWQSTAPYQITKTSTSVTVGGGALPTVILPKTTSIVVYDTDAETAKVYTGPASLGNTVLTGAGTDVITFKGVAKGNTSSTATASLIFALVDGGIVKTADNYAYVDVSKESEELVDGKTNYVYTGTLADGSTVELRSGDDDLDYNGLYKYDEDGRTKDSYYLTGALYGHTYSASVSGDMLLLGGTYYDMSEADIVYIDSDLDEVDGNECYFVLADDNGSATKDIEAIFVVD